MLHQALVPASERSLALTLAPAPVLNQALVPASERSLALARVPVHDQALVPAAIPNPGPAPDLAPEHEPAPAPGPRLNAVGGGSPLLMVLGRMAVVVALFLGVSWLSKNG